MWTALPVALRGISATFNGAGEPLTLASLRGRVVLLDFGSAVRSTEMKPSICSKYSRAVAGPVKISGNGIYALSGWSRMPRM